MIVWILIQIAALAVSAFRVRWAPGMDEAGERYALVVMVVTQIGAAALLSASLLRDVRQSFIAIVTAWPFALLAAILGDVGLRRFFVAESYATVWLAGLCAWNWALPRFKAQISAVALLISFGGVALWYLHAEFVRDSADVDWNRDGIWGTLMGGVSQSVPSPAVTNAWWIPAIIFATALFVSWLRRKRCGKSDRVAVANDVDSTK
jgi:hypothetical protein